MSTTSSPATACSNGAAPGGSRPRVASPAKDLAICAVILCGASIAWFGWGHQGGRLTMLLSAGSVLAVLATIAAGVGVVRTPGTSSMSVNADLRCRYWAAVGAEVVLIAAGSFGLGILQRPEYLSAWVLAVVGGHFLPLARAFRLPLLTAAAAGCVLVAAAAVLGDLAGGLPAPTVVGLGGGVVLLTAGLLSLRPASR